MFLAMILKNAQRAEAKGVALSVLESKPSIHLLLHDGSSQPVTAPPADVVMKIINCLDGGQREFRSSVFIVTIETVNVMKGGTTSVAQIMQWSIGHT